MNLNKTLKLTLVASATLVASLIPATATPELYQQKCFACHQANGAGLPNVFPPLAESEWVNGPAENLIRIQLRGLTGPITVKGATYNSAMPANAAMTDEEIATILTYVRSNFGNKADAVTADMVKALRSEVGKPMLTVADLIDPAKAGEAKKEEEKK
jgi:quinoprotein glucose dehydrogenase